MTAAGTRMTMFGKASMVAGLALVAAFGVAINAAADFEKKMDYFGAVNNATAKEMEVVRQKALELGRTSMYSAGQIADAFVEMGKAGVSVTDITGGLADAIVNMATAADINLTEATNIVTSQIQAYSMAASDAAHVTNVMAGAANASIIDVTDLGVSLKYVGGVAHGLGISFDSTVDAISLLGKAGIKGSTAGTSLRQIMVSLAGGTKKAQTELKNLGIITADGSNKFFTAEGKAKSLAEVFQILQDHTANLSDKERLMAFRTIFNNRALAAASILTKAGAKGFADMNTQISKTTAADVAAKRMDNLSGDVHKLKAAIDTLLITAGTPFQNMLRGIVQWLTRLITGFIRLPQSVQTGILAFIGILGVTLTLMGAFILFFGIIFKFVAVFGQLRAALVLVWGVVKPLILAFRALALTMLANPIFWVIAAVIALGVAFYLLWNRSEAFRNGMKSIGSAIKSGFMAVVNWFTTLPKWFSDRWKEISSAFSVGVNWVKKNWDILLALLTGPLGIIILVWRRFGDEIVNFFKAIPGAVTSFVSMAVSAALDFAGKLPYYIGYALGFVLGLIVRFGIIAGVTLYNWTVTATTAIVNFFMALPGIVGTALGQMMVWVVNFTVNFTMTIVNMCVAIYNGVVTWFQKLPGRTAAFFTDMWHRSQAAWNSFLSGSKSFAINSYNAVVTWFQRLPGRVYGFFVDMKNRAMSAGSSLVSGARNIGSSVYSGITSWLSRIPGAAWNAISSAISAFKNMLSSAWSAAKDFAKGLWDGFKSGLGINSPSLIEKQMWQITAVTEAETKRLGTHVRLMQNMYGTISKVDPAKAAANLNVATIGTMTKSMASQAAMLATAGAALFPLGGQASLARSSGAMSAPSGTSSTAQGSPLVEKNINVQVFNPVAERASDTTARKLRQLSDMGAL
jgi:TP901 family phage tail tape measure protein